MQIIKKECYCGLLSYLNYRLVNHLFNETIVTNKPIPNNTLTFDSEKQLSIEILNIGIPNEIIFEILQYLKPRGWTDEEIEKEIKLRKLRELKKPKKICCFECSVQ